MPPGVEAWSPNHWTTREVPGLFFFFIKCLLCQAEQRGTEDEMAGWHH